MSQTQSSRSETPASQERRKYPRFRVRERLLGYLVESDLPVRIRDISFGGFATETLEPLTVGRAELVRFTSRDDHTAQLQAQSVHSWPSCADDGTPCYVTGFAFVGEIERAKADILRLIEVVTASTLYRDE